jgi:hypothetical protein
MPHDGSNGARYQMYVDDLPAWALVGDYGEGGEEVC